MSLRALPSKLIERIVVLLPLSDICSLRLANRHLASNTAQKYFKASFRTKRVQITEKQLGSFVAVTAFGGLGCLLQDLTLVAPVYNTLELSARLEEKATDFVELDDDGQFAGREYRDMTEEELRQAGLDLVVLQERLATQLDMIRHQRDVELLSQAFSNLAANGASLHMLRLEVEIFKDDATTSLLPLFGGHWKPIWTSAAHASHTLFTSLANCDLQIRVLDLFNSTRMLRCSLSCSEFNNVDFAFVRLGGSFRHLTELSLRVSDHTVNRESYDEILNKLTQVADFEGLRSLLRTCHNVQKLDLAHFSLRYVNNSNTSSQGVLQTLAESELPSLQALALQGFRTTGDELVALLQKFKTLRSLSLRNIVLTQGGFQRMLDYCTMSANMEEVNMDSLFAPDLVQFEPPYVVRSTAPRSLLAGYPDSRASYRRTSDDATSHRIKARIRSGRTLDAGYIRSWRQDLKNRFGPLNENGKPSCLQPYVSAENTWRYP
jgi:hypothetical protein